MPKRASIRILQTAIEASVLAAIAGAFILTAACAKPDGSSRRTFSRTDSAGIELVVNSAPQWAPGKGWTIDSVPRLAIGEGADTVENLTAITRLLRLGNGALVLAHGRTELRFYDSTGKRMAIAGRAGKGPGEFSAIGGMFACGGDSVLVADASRRVSLWNASGMLVRDMTQPVLSQKTAALVVGTAGDCASLLLQSSQSPTSFVPSGQATSTLYWRSLVDSTQSTIVSFPGISFVMATYKGMESRQPIVWSPQPDYSMGANRIVVGDGGSAEYRAYDLRGKLTRIVRWSAQPDPVTDGDRADFNAARQEYLDRNPGDDSPVVPPIEALQTARTKPFYAMLRVDDAGNVWVCKCADKLILYKRMLRSTQDNPWTVFDSTGTMLGNLTVPAGLEMQYISSEEIGGVRRDANDVPSAHIYRIRRP